MAEQLKPAEVFSPGEYLNDELGARGWTQHEFAELTGLSPKLLKEIIEGKSPIGPPTAVAIGAALGTGANVWVNLEKSFARR